MTDQIQGRRQAEDRVEPVRVDDSSTASSKANGRPATRGFDTLAVHAGERVAPVGNWLPISAPIYPSNTFVYPTAAELDAAFDGEGDGYVYTRHGNPTVVAFERAVAALEGAAAAVACGSGMAALHLALLASDVKAGSHVVASRSLYGASATLLEGVFAALGVT
ncbi:MAG: PLP-dependent transferase, partial [Chloroflexi bacterium]|nr:PLP-dependent transferase [Chloroflexota bacterium]